MDSEDIPESGKLYVSPRILQEAIHVLTCVPELESDSSEAENLAQELLVLANHPLVASSYKDLWVDVMYKLKFDPAEFINTQFDEFLHVITSNTTSDQGGTSQINDLTVCTALCQITDLTCSAAGFTVPALSRLCEATSLPAGPGSAAILDPGLEQAGREAVLNAAGTLSRISPDQVLPRLIGVITDSLQNPALCQVTREEYAIMLTPEGELYDKSILHSAQQDSLKKANMKRENKAYSFKEQIIELELKEGSYLTKELSLYQEKDSCLVPSPSPDESSISRSPSLGASREPGSEEDSDTSQDQEFQHEQETLDSLIESINKALKLDEEPLSKTDHAVSFKRTKQAHRVFTNHPEFKEIVESHRIRPDKRFTGQMPMLSKYPFAPDLRKDCSQSLLVDPPVSHLATKSILSSSEGASIKDPTDCQIDNMARSAFEASAAVRFPSFAATWVAKDMTLWAKVLPSAVLDTNLPPEVAGLATQIARAGDFLVTASLDAADCASQAAANAITIRRAKASEFFQAINSPKEDWIIIPVPQSERFQGLYSNLFIVPKKDGTVQPILDPKLLNKSIRVQRFRMESLRSVIVSMEKGEFLASIDIQDAYLHIPIFPSHQRLLRFAVQEQHFQFVALPFGLTTALRVFTKVMAAAVAIFHTRGVVVLPYLDDILIKGPSFRACKKAVNITIDSLFRLGWKINFKKSSPEPAQRISFLGMILDSSHGLVLLPPEKISALQREAQKLSQPRTHSLHFSMRVLGRMVAALEAVPFVQLHLRPLHHALLAVWDRNPFSLERPSPASQTVSQVVDIKVLPESREVFSSSTLASCDNRCQSSRLGSGVLTSHCSGPLVTSGITPSDQHLRNSGNQVSSSTIPSYPGGSPIRIQSDNTTAVAYINRQGGTRSMAAMNEVGYILSWAEENRSMISAVHIPGVDNWEADFLSRQGLDSGEWSLHPEIFHQICCRWGTPDADLMASRLNSKVPDFIARSHGPAAIGADALLLPWHHFLLPYIFPPLPLLPRVIRKIRAEGVPVILIAPDWPRRAWYAELVQLVADVHWRLPNRADLLSQGPIYHQNSEALCLTAWLLSPGF
ncbi:unnamed protein product [Ranitomeya imitator]|uniref:ribonuclease H n=1 Tax=Ranitomeya imitator TaxID=111125 RepID=A0ABN9MF07_9NEOB|nr:unnamed protein product [Ranitomeya imitator]